MRPSLNALVAEAAQALSVLDVERLEGLSHTCEVLNRDFSPETRHAYACELRAAPKEMAALAKVLEVTRANLAVMERIRMMRTNRLEYTVTPQPDPKPLENSHGLN